MEVALWTEKENTLVKERGTFALAINFADSDISRSLYEYDPILEVILHLSDDNIHYGQGMEQHHLVQIIPQKQFALVRRDWKFNIELVGQYDSNDTTINMIKEDQLKLSEKTDKIYTYEYSYVIINLRNMTPYFMKLGEITEFKMDKVGQFYSGSTVEPIIF